ncbi:MAG TPA: hypothetical protein DCL73_09620 [Treponema sp.]|nr:hypothetical protein [Treponema sp.]
MKRFFLFFTVFLFLFSIPLAAEGFSFREITAIKNVYFSNNRHLFEIDNTFAVSFSPHFTAEIKNNLIKTDYGERYSLQPGCIWIFNKNVYMETLFGPFIDNENQYYWDGYSEVVSETDRTIFSACFRAGFVPDTNVFFCVPNSSLLYQFTPLYAAKVKYFFGFSTDNFLSHSVYMENIFTFRKNTIAVLSSGRIQESSNVIGYAWSAGLRYERQVTAGFVLKYIAEYLREPLDVWGINGIFTLDVKF